MAENPVRDEARAWFDKATQDLEVATIVRDHEGPATVGCFLCQQALEKLLKAVLVFRGLPVPRTHDLVALHHALATSGTALGLDARDLAQWTDYAVASRYPGFGDPRSESDFGPLLSAAEHLADGVRGLLFP